MSSTLTIYVLYNASASLWGKISFGVRRLSAVADGPSACGALDLTHGGLKSEEKPEWKDIKKRVPAKVEQLFQDELPLELKKFVASNHYSYPCIVGSKEKGLFKLLMASYEIEECTDQYEVFLERLKLSTTAAGLPWESS